MLRRLAVVFLSCVVPYVPAFSQDAPASETGTPGRTQGWGLMAGFNTGDEIGRSPGWPSAIEGLSAQPELDDTPLVGAFYWIDATKRLRFELRLFAGPTEVAPTCPGAATNDPIDCAAKATATDGILWSFEMVLMPHFDWGKWHLGIPLTLGWGLLEGDEEFAPPSLATGRGENDNVESSSGATYGLGLRPYYDIGAKSSIFLEVRALKYHRLLSVNYATAHTAQVAAGVHFAF